MICKRGCRTSPGECPRTPESPCCRRGRSWPCPGRRGNTRRGRCRLQNEGREEMVRLREGSIITGDWESNIKSTLSYVKTMSCYVLLRKERLVRLLWTFHQSNDDIRVGNGVRFLTLRVPIQWAFEKSIEFVGKLNRFLNGFSILRTWKRKTPKIDSCDMSQNSNWNLNGYFNLLNRHPGKSVLTRSEFHALEMGKLKFDWVKY